MSIILLFGRIYYFCIKFVLVLYLHELTYGILADLSARLNLVNSTFDARISHSRFVASKEDTGRFAYSASRHTRAEPGNDKGIPCSPFFC